MLQDIAPRRYDITWKKQEIAPNDYLLCYDGANALFVDGDTPRLPTAMELASSYDGPVYYGFSIDDMRFFIAYDTIAAPEGMCYRPAREFLNVEPQWLGFAGMTGWQLFRWYNANVYCGKCGKPMVNSRTERARVCSECGNTVYPKICPAVIIGLTDGHDRIVVTKYAGNAGARHYALIAGFVETGETFEDCVRREVMEEVGLKVKDIRYYKSQPWSLTDTLLAGFYCTLDGSDEIHMDEGELSVARWISRGELEMDYHSPALTYEMLREFSLGHQG